MDEGKEDGKVILPALAPTPRPTLFHALVGPSAKKKRKKKASKRKIKQAGGEVG